MSDGSLRKGCGRIPTCIHRNFFYVFGFIYWFIYDWLFLVLRCVDSLCCQACGAWRVLQMSLEVLRPCRLCYGWAIGLGVVAEPSSSASRSASCGRKLSASRRKARHRLGGKTSDDSVWKRSRNPTYHVVWIWFIIYYYTDKIGYRLWFDFLFYWHSLQL